MTGGHRVVFLGPTLSAGEARRCLDVEILPPVELGDVWRISQERPAAIGIVDGYFHQVPAVWHKEILYALSRGIAVYGASSMGALRAAELSIFGMVGVGEIADAFARGELEADDEVALVHAPAELGYQNLSEPLVNIRATLARAQHEGIVSAADAGRLLGSARALPYPERSWQRLLNGLPLAAQALAAWLPAGRVDQKRADALAMLARMRDDAEAGTVSPAPTPFVPTVLWQELLLRETPLPDIVDEFLLLDPLSPAVAEALASLRRGQPGEARDALAATPEWPACCRRARHKRAVVAEHADAADADALLAWFFGERLGWAADLGAFLLARGWTEPQGVLRIATREAAFLAAAKGSRGG